MVVKQIPNIFHFLFFVLILKSATATIDSADWRDENTHINQENRQQCLPVIDCPIDKLLVCNLTSSHCECFTNAEYSESREICFKCRVDDANENGQPACGQLRSRIFIDDGRHSDSTIFLVLIGGVVLVGLMVGCFRILADRVRKRNIKQENEFNRAVAESRRAELQRYVLGNRQQPIPNNASVVVDLSSLRLATTIDESKPAVGYEFGDCSPPPAYHDCVPAEHFRQSPAPPTNIVRD